MDQTPALETPKTAFVVLWALYFLVYLGLQLLQLFLLARIYWMRKKVFNIIDPNIAVKYDLHIEKYQGQFVAARNAWADDKWGFGQIMSLALWLPMVVEMMYLIAGMPLLIQLVLYVRLDNGGLVTIVGEKRGLTGRLPEPWTAAET